MTTRQSLLAMTATAGFLALPVLAFAQQGGSAAGSANPPQANQTAPAGKSGNGATAQGRDASGGTLAQTQGHNTSNPPDGTPGNPPSTATQRATDSVTGNRTPPDGTPGNPPGTAATRAIDRTLGTNMSGAHPENENKNSQTGATTTTTTTTSTTGSTSPTMAVDSNTLQNNRRASKVIGSTVYNEGNEAIGEVDDILIPPGGSGEPVAVISVGGFLGIGSRLVAVPYDRLQMNAQNNRWTLPGATKDSLNSLPPFNYNNTNTNKG
jgi:hypothetical protein